MRLDDYLSLGAVYTVLLNFSGGFVSWRCVLFLWISRASGKRWLIRSHSLGTSRLSSTFIHSCKSTRIEEFRHGSRSKGRVKRCYSGEASGFFPHRYERDGDIQRRFGMEWF